MILIFGNEWNYDVHKKIFVGSGLGGNVTAVRDIEIKNRFGGIYQFSFNFSLFLSLCGCK